MNPLVKDMLESAHSHDIELRFLEDMLNEECKCESLMHDSGCTNEVTHRGFRRCANVSKNVCADAAAYIVKSKSHPLYYCSDCGESTRLCWTITPI